MSNTLARRSVGVVAGFLTLLMAGMIPRQLNMWSATHDQYYLGSVGFYLVLAAFCFVGVAWGFWRGEKAGEVYAGIGGLVATGSMVVALYYWVTGFVLSRDKISIFIALTMFFSGVVIFVLIAVFQRLVGSDN